MRDDTNTMNTITIIIKAQTHEWYGDEDHIGEVGFGRYKCKGGTDFVVDVNRNDYLFEPTKIKELFERKYNRKYLFFRYTWIDSEIYTKPVEIELNSIV